MFIRQHWQWLRFVCSITTVTLGMAFLTPLFALENPPQPTPTQTVGAPLSPRSDVLGAPNLAQVSPTLWRSAQPSAEGFRNLKALGIKTIVNLCAIHSDRDELKGLGLGYHHIRFKTWHPEDKNVVAFLKVVTDPNNQPVLVHCQYGADRTGMMVASYRALIEGWTMDEAMAELPRFGFHTIWGNIKRYLRQLDKEKIRRQMATAPAPKVEIVP